MLRPWSGCILLVTCLILCCTTVYCKKVPRKKCELCKNIAEKFNEGLKRTAKSNFGGGNTHWEEKSLGSFATSETRFVDITEHGLCDSDKDCHLLFEQHEETLEDWWFNVFSKDQNSDLFKWFCIEQIKVCCHKNTFGENCDACPGGTERPCKGNGKCDGEGTRDGTGTCDCHSGYKGELCDDCVDGYFEEMKNETHTSCQKCHESCQSTCWEAGPKGCDECKTGWKQSETDGCQDINECEADTYPCSESEYCTNTPGSYSCTKCDEACSQCLGAGNDKCVKCSEGYSMNGTTCIDINECERDDTCKGDHQSCENTVGSYKCQCDDGYEMNEEDDECIPKPKEPVAEEKVEEPQEKVTEETDTKDNIKDESKDEL